MAWQPQSEPLNQLAQCLCDSISGHDAAAQKNSEQMLRQAKASPDMNNYLVYLCITPNSTTGLPQDAYHAARTAAAIMLKNNVKASYKSIPDSSKAYIKSNVLMGLRDRSSQVRNYLGNVISEVVRQGGILGWPQVLSALSSMVLEQTSADSPGGPDGAMGAIQKICEDNRKALDEEYGGQRPLEFLLPQLIKFTLLPAPKLKSQSLGAINVFLSTPISPIVRVHMDEILKSLVRVSTDGDIEVRRSVCRAFALLADASPEVLVPHLQGIVEYTLSQQQDIHNEELALDAAEFFFEASGNATLREKLGGFLEKIVPVLLDCMVYSEDDQIRLEGDDDDADVEDRAQDIEPQFATSKANVRAGDIGGTSTPSSNGQAKPAANGFAFEDDADLSEGEIEDDDDLDGINPEDEWNLRKCSASALDSLAVHFGGTVFQYTLPWLIENLKHNDWPNREAAVLALGAIGVGCMDDIKQHLPELIPYLLSLLNDQQPVVRQITCWSLGRYASWAAHGDQSHKQQFFEPIMDGLLQRMLDHNKKVQESAASAFAHLEEKATAELTPYCNVILKQYIKCFQKYKDKNIYILYDCVQTLAEHSASALAQPENVELLMPALIERWKKVQDQSREMFPLLECLSFVATALGAQFAPYAEPLFARCINIIEKNLEEGLSAEYQDAYFEAPEKDFLVTSLDLLSSIIQALDDAQSTRLAASAQPNMFELLAYCMRDNNNDVKQSAYALLGDCAIYIFPQLQQYLSVILEVLITQLDLSEANEDPETAFRVVNNACWSCGEISMRQKDGMAPYVDRLLEKLGTIMLNNDVPDSLSENAAIALGRLGIGCHQQLAPHLAKFASPFLRAMAKVSWTDEKGHAYKGFVNIVLDNPQALESCLLDFFMEMASVPASFMQNTPNDGPRQGFERALAQYKSMIGDGFDAFLRNLPAEQYRALQQLYSV